MELRTRIIVFITEDYGKVIFRIVEEMKAIDNDESDSGEEEN